MEKEPIVDKKYALKEMIDGAYGEALNLLRNAQESFGGEKRIIASRCSQVLYDCFVDSQKYDYDGIDFPQDKFEAFFKLIDKAHEMEYQGRKEEFIGHLQKARSSVGFERSVNAFFCKMDIKDDKNLRPEDVGTSLEEIDSLIKRSR